MKKSLSFGGLLVTLPDLSVYDSFTRRGLQGFSASKLDIMMFVNLANSLNTSTSLDSKSSWNLRALGLLVNRASINFMRSAANAGHLKI